MALQDNPKELLVEFLEDKAWILAEQARPEESLSTIEMAISKDSRRARATYLKGRALAMLGHLEEAKQQMLKTLELDPGYKDATVALKKLDAFK